MCIEIVLNRRIDGHQKRFEFVESGPVATLQEEPEIRCIFAIAEPHARLDDERRGSLAYLASMCAKTSATTQAMT